MNKKIVFFDLDGTLLNEEKKLLESSKLAIKKLQENNIITAVATGRTPALLEGFGISINATKSGYYFTEKSKALIIEKDIIRSCLDVEYIFDIPTTPFERQMYIILNLTFFEKLDLEALANQLFVSDSTLRNDIKFVKDWLKINLGLTIST